MTRLAGISAAAALVIGCSPTTNEQGFTTDFRSAGAATVSGPLTIEVENHRPTEMKIYLVNDGARVFVGEVGVRQRAMFTMPRALLGPRGQFRLVADPRGSTSALESELISARGDHTVNWLLRRGGGDRVRLY